MKKQRWLSGLLVLGMILALLTVSVGAEPAYAASGSLETAKPTKEAILAKWKEVRFADEENLYVEEPSVQAPYKAGKLTESNLQSGLTYLNYIRFVANLPAVTLDETMNEDVQYGTVVLAANDALTHYPSQPADMDDAFYQRGYGATTSSNLSSRKSSYYAEGMLQSHLQGCVDDSGSNNLSEVGHRRWLLSPSLQKVGLGMAVRVGNGTYYYSAYAGTKVMGGDTHATAPDYDFISWPSSGNFPTNLMDTDVPWSISLNLKKYKAPELENLKITLTRESDGKTWSFDKNTGGPESSRETYLTVSHVNYGYTGNSIIFRPEYTNIGSYSGIYTVKVEGLQDKSGKDTTLQYQVDFFDLEDVCSHTWQDATCTTPKTCSVCGETEGKSLGHDANQANCTTESVCSRCGNVVAKAWGHSWREAGCDYPKTCWYCGLTEGEALGHNWTGGDCTTPATCTRCRRSDYDNVGHKWVDGNCTVDTTCSVCGEVRKAQGHTWSLYVNCTEPMTCAVCGATQGEAPGHSWREATCTVPKTCSRCNAKEGEAAGHQWAEASCTAPKVCKVCYVTEGEILPHSYVNGICTGCGTSDPNAAMTLTRLAGSNRYDTALKAADALKRYLRKSKFSTVIVSSGEQFADALAGSYLASVKNAPILLVKDRNKEMDQVKTYIKDNLMPGGTVYLLGGTAAVPAKMETGLDGFRVVRLGGNDRYATNLLILKEAGVAGKDVAVCTGKNFADSLSASAVGLPILLVKDSLKAEQKELLSGNTGKIYIIGGKNAVSEKVEKQLTGYGAVTRLAGETRYKTSILVAETFFHDPTTAVMAYGENFPDGLSGGPLAYAAGAPLILTRSGRETDARAYVAGKNIHEGYVLGGTTVLPEKCVNKVFGLS